MFGSACPAIDQRDSRTLLAASEQPTPVTLIGLPTIFRCSLRASATSTSVLEDPVSTRKGKARPWVTTRASASVSPSRALRMTSGAVEATCADGVDANPQPVKATSTNEPTSPARAMKRRTLPPFVGTWTWRPGAIEPRGSDAEVGLAARARGLRDGGGRDHAVRGRNTGPGGGRDLRRMEVDAGGGDHLDRQLALQARIWKVVDAVPAHAAREAQKILRVLAPLGGLRG